MDDKDNTQVRTRFAPSPTGLLHIGGLRTALYDYLIAKKSDGKFILRIEDTDRNRLVEGATANVIQGLQWAKIPPEEGAVDIGENGQIIQKGEYGPYVQSQRLKIYQEQIKVLLDKGHAYHCFCSRERLAKLRADQQAAKQAPKYDKLCLALDQNEVDSRLARGEKSVIRLNVPAKQTIEFNDAVYGKVSVKSETIDDQVLIKSDGYPTYHFAVVVDDHLMGITHVTRGEDWLPSTPKHILLYQFFGWTVPAMIHFPNIQGENRKKLSKREGDASVADFIRKGYLPEAIVNFIALLGWNPKNEQEYFSLDELEKVFDVSSLHKAGAVFDYKKLDWMNSHYLKNKSVSELVDLCLPYFEQYFKTKKIKPDSELLAKICQIEQERIKKLSEITENIDFYFITPNPSKELLRWKQMEDNELSSKLQEAYNILEAIKEDDFTMQQLEEKLFEAAKDKKGELLWPLRVALSGKEKSPSPFELAWAIGKKEALQRLKNAIQSVKN